MMEKIYEWPLKRKLQFGTYSIAALFSLALLIFGLMSDKLILALIMIIGMLVISFFLTTMTENLINQSIDDLTNAAMSIARGDFTQSLHSSYEGSFGKLVVAINQMKEKLREILTETTHITQTVFTKSRDMHAKNKNFVEVIKQVNTSTDELATGANQISEDVANITSSIIDIENKVNDYTHSTQEMNQQSEQMMALVDQGRSAVEIQSDGMQRTVTATQNVSQAIQELANQVEGISKITRSISDIAEQTNLLSLNASIEAARAGEHGKGFAVVALEVRNLADQSSNSTREVFQLVQGIESGIKRAVENIQINQSIVDEQNRLIQQTEKIFSEIVHGVRFIGQQIFQFSRESEMMLESAKRIAASMENISSITQQSAAGTEEVSASMKEQMATIEDMVEQAEQMTNMVSRLQKTIDVFKF